MANDYISPNPSSLSKPFTFYSGANLTGREYQQSFSTSETTALNLFLASIGVPDGALRPTILSRVAYTYGHSVPYYSIKYSYDYAWESNDTLGYDVPIGNGIIPPVSRNESGFIESNIEIDSRNDPLTQFIVPNPALFWGVTSVDNVEGPGRLTISNLKIDVTTGVNTYYSSIIVAVLPVPEPETYALMLAGLGLIGFAARRRQFA